MIIYTQLKNGFLLVVFYFTTIIMSYAQFQPALIFQSGLVIQQNVSVPIWGKAGVGDSITVSFNGTIQKGKTDSLGKWEITLAPLVAGGPFTMTITSNAGSTKTLSNVYVGDVWLAAGQSNMEFALSADVNGSKAIATANYQDIRQFKIPKGLTKEISDELPGGSWTAATSGTAGNFSAVAYYFARALKPHINVPIGIVNATYGGARIEAYMSEKTLGFDEDFTVLQPSNFYAERQPTQIYNRMIHPLLKFPVKGILWYQGESNADALEDAKGYGILFKKLIKQYRTEWGLGDIPFIWVQLPNNGTAAIESNPQSWDSWPQLRAGQDRALELPNTGEAITLDVGGVDIHPTNKEPVGKRLALVACKLVYQETILSSGPRYKSHKDLGNGHTEITFDYVGDSLIGSTAKTVKWFSIAGSDGLLSQANAKITSSNTIDVWNDNITSPEIIRYAWEMNPAGVNLYNPDTLPAAPFYLYLHPKGYELTSFTADNKTIERGQVVNLSWKTSGASSITLNGAEVDSCAWSREYPKSTTTYTLKTINRADNTQMDSVVIVVTVIDPQPDITLTSSLGSIIATKVQTTFKANASVPGGGTIRKVEFFVDGASIAIDSVLPYETNWKSDTTGEFHVTAIATDIKGNSTVSNPIDLLVTNLKVDIYEAENSIFTGSATKKTNAAASGGKLLQVQQVWTITFDSVFVPKAGTYQLSIGYQLTFESPKTQSLYVNGVKQSVTFTAPDITSILVTRVDVMLNAGYNEIRFEPDWAWMSFDYISVAYQDITGIHSVQTNKREIDLEIQPNPFESSFRVTYTTIDSGKIDYTIFNTSGNLIQKGILENSLIGKQQQVINTSNLSKGIYILKVSQQNKSTIKYIIHQ